MTPTAIEMIEASGVVVLELSGDELAGLYAARATVARKAADELETRLGKIRARVAKDVGARLEEAEKLEEVELVGQPITLPGRVDLRGYNLAIDAAKRTADFYAYMGSHVDRKRSYRVNEHTIRELVGPVTGGPMFGTPAHMPY